MQVVEITLGPTEEGAGLGARKTHEAGRGIDGQPEVVMQEHDVGLVFPQDGMKLPRPLRCAGCATLGLGTEISPGSGSRARAAQCCDPAWPEVTEYHTHTLPCIRLIPQTSMGVTKVGIAVGFAEGRELQPEERRAGRSTVVPGHVNPLLP
ncbi:hypothetical protein B9W62_27405 [Streptomyces sp. CS113]|nr:hypothetical protein B9W62_27405 [Streptomyces sp. CS113]